MENKIVAFFMMEIVYLFGFYTIKEKTIRFIKYVRINFKFYPRHYAMPNRFFRKIFELKKEKIAKYLYLSLWLAFVFGIMFFVAPVLFLCAPMASMVTVVVFGVVYSLDIILMYVVSAIFEKTVPK